MPLKIRPGGINIITDPATGAQIEAYSSTCFHCQHITDFPSRKRMFEFVDVCRGCMKLICLSCVGKPCLPYEKVAEQQELAHRLQSRVHMQAWRCY